MAHETSNHIDLREGVQKFLNALIIAVTVIVVLFSLLLRAR